MPFLDTGALRAHKLRNALHSTLLVGGLGLLTGFSAWLIWGGMGVAVTLVAMWLIYAFAPRLPPDFEQMADSLGARPAYRLRRVTLPLLAPYLLAAFSLAFALSMGELGATVMVYPPGWVTMPVGIFALTDRGDVFTGAALTMVLVAVTLAVLLLVSLIPTRAAQR